MKRLVVFVGLVVLLAVPLIAYAGFTVSPRLLAGQTEFAGVVRASGNADLITLEFALRAGAGFCITESAAHVGLSLDDFPQNPGGAIPGQFDFKTDHDGCVTSFTYQIPVQPDWYGNAVFIATHAVVVTPDGDEETGWAVNCGNLEGGQFPGNNWSAYFIFPANAWN